MPIESKFVVPFRELRLSDIPRVGGKNASLGELIRFLVPMGVRVPDGFAVTAEAFVRIWRPPAWASRSIRRCRVWT
jgi:pyruvate,water dikinase